MATLRIQKADAIVFQLLRRDLSNPDSNWVEHRVVPLAVKPTAIRYGYSGRSSEVQTIPGHGFIDRYGRALTAVTLFGTFGVQPRRAGLIPKDGFTRLLEFRDEVFSLSHQARKRDGDDTAEYVYAVNYYDFINDERFAVDLKSFSPDWNARRSTIEAQYSMTLIELGPIVEAETRDPLLRVILAFDNLLERGLQALDDANTLIRNAPIAGDAIDALEGLSALVDTTDTLAGNISTLSAMYRNAVSGNLRPDRQLTTGMKSIFSSIKG